MAGSAQPVPASLTWTDGLGSAVLYATTGRLDNWTPDAEDIGVRVTLLGTGQTARFVYRRDYTTTFEMSALSPASMLLMHRFKLWAESGGQFTVNTQDRNQATYSCLIKPDYQIQWTLDRQTLTYTMQVGARNAAAASMACQYTSFLGTGYTITVTPNPLTMGPNVGNQVQLTAVVSDPSGAAVTIPVVWSSSNPAVASVDQTGTVTALTTGSCNIIASAGGTATAVPCAVNITQVPVTITLSPTSLAFTATTYTGTPALPVNGVPKSGVPPQVVTATIVNGSGQTVPYTPGLIQWSATGGAVALTDNNNGTVSVTPIAGNGSGVVQATINNPDGSVVSQSINYSTVAEVPAILVPNTNQLTLTAVGASANISVQTLGQYGNVIP